MKLSKWVGLVSLVLALATVAPAAYAATSPGLGSAGTFVVLSDTYSNSSSGTTLTGDLGYTTPPATAPTLSGSTYVADSTYNQAGINQGAALNNLNSQPCTFNFAPGPIDLASDTTHGPVGVYNPGVYCATGSVSVGGGGTITLDGAGTYIFRMDGALTTSANSIVQTLNGATPCDIWWTPTQATTLGANSYFIGTDLDASGITVGGSVTWVGAALAFGGTVSTTGDTISVPACGPSRTTSTTVATTPGLPNTGVAPQDNSIVWTGVAVAVLAVGSSTYFIRKKV